MLHKRMILVYEREDSFPTPVPLPLCMGLWWQPAHHRTRSVPRLLRYTLEKEQRLIRSCS